MNFRKKPKRARFKEKQKRTKKNNGPKKTIKYGTWHANFANQE